jgi:hypothetical protein
MLKRQLDAKAGGPEQREWRAGRTRSGGRHAPGRNRVCSRGNMAGQKVRGGREGEGVKGRGGGGEGRDGQDGRGQETAR